MNQTNTYMYFRPRTRNAAARDRLRALGEIADSGDDPVKAFDRMVRSYHTLSHI